MDSTAPNAGIKCKNWPVRLAPSSATAGFQKMWARIEGNSASYRMLPTVAALTAWLARRLVTVSQAIVELLRLP